MLSIVAVTVRYMTLLLCRYVNTQANSKEALIRNKFGEFQKASKRPKHV